MFFFRIFKFFKIFREREGQKIEAFISHVFFLLVSMNF